MKRRSTLARLRRKDAVHDGLLARRSLADARWVDPYSAGMPHAQHAPVRIRAADRADLDQLVALEHLAFPADRMSRRSFSRFLTNPHADLLVAERNGAVDGYALVLFREDSDIARLYSIAVAPHAAGRGLGGMLLSAAEDAAAARGRLALRLEVHEKNATAIRRYQRSGYRHFGHHQHYYEDRGHALRFEKRIAVKLRGQAAPPPYFHQTTEFTCGPACVMMALAWANRSWRPDQALEFQLWREATTIFMSSGPGGCDPYGLALALRRRGLDAEIHVSQPGPYFLDTVRTDDQRRVMRVTQEEFRREADEAGIPTHLTRLSESALMTSFDAGAVAIVLVCGYHMVRRNVPHWVFAFGHEDGRILMHDPAAVRDPQGNAAAPETYAIPRERFRRCAQYGRDRLSAAILIRKGSLQ